MKVSRITMVIFLLVIFAVGCATVRPIEDENAQDVLIEITARRLAYHVALNNPKIIDPGIVICTSFEQPDVDLRPMLAEGIKKLNIEVANDPLLQADLESLLKLFNIPIDQGQSLTDRQKAIIVLAAKSFKLGLLLAQENMK